MGRRTATKSLRERLTDEIGHWPRTSTLDPLLREAVAEIDRLARLELLAKQAAWLHGCCWDLSDGSGCFIPKDSMARFDEVFVSLSEELGAVVLDEEEERELFQQPFARAQRAEAEVERLRAELLDASPAECVQCRARVAGSRGASELSANCPLAMRTHANA